MVVTAAVHLADAVGKVASEPEPLLAAIFDSAMPKEIYSKPSDVTAEEGRVLVDGPDSVDVALTPEAAEETGARLIDEAARAAGQDRESRIDHRPK